MHFDLAQIVGIIASALIITAFAHKSDSYYKYFVMFGALMFAAHFYLLGALAGMFVNVINCIRTGSSIKFHQSNLVLGFFIISYLAAGWFIYETPKDILPVFSGCLASFAMFKFSGIKLRLCMYINSISWITYGILVFSIGGIITETFIIITNTITIYRLLKDKKV